jgi:hypothetical protein
MYLMIIMHTRFPAKLNNILYYATVIETGKHQEIYYIGAGLALAGIRDRSAAARVVSLAVIGYIGYRQCNVY